MDFALWTPPCRVNGGTLLGDDDRRPVFTQALAHGESGVGPALACRGSFIELHMK